MPEDMPPANQSVEQRARVSRQPLVFAEGEKVYQVGIDLVESVEIGESAQRQRIPGIDDNTAAVQVVAGSTSAFIRADSPGCRCLVERFRKCVVKLPSRFAPQRAL